MHPRIAGESLFLQDSLQISREGANIEIRGERRRSETLKIKIQVVGEPCKKIHGRFPGMKSNLSTNSLGIPGLGMVVLQGNLVFYTSNHSIYINFLQAEGKPAPGSQSGLI